MKKENITEQNSARAVISPNINTTNQATSLLTDTAKPLFAFARQGVPEVIIHGTIHTKIEDQQIEGCDQRTVVVTRSLLKPWQFLANDVADDNRYWALGLASHSAQPDQIDALHELCKIADATEDDLICPRCYPFDWEISAKMRLEGTRPSRLHHPCAGKHLVMMAACRKNDYPIANYWNPEHPIQKKIYNVVGRETHEKPTWVTGPCGVPTIAVSAKSLMGMWERLVQRDDKQYELLRKLWTENPRLVGGYRRLDSDIVEITEGRILAKEGGDGLIILQSLPIDDEPIGSILVKIASGYHTAYLALALWSALSQENNLPKVFQTVKEYLRSRLEEWVPREQDLVMLPYK